MTIAMTMGVPSRLIEPEKIGELEQAIGNRLNNILDSGEDFALSLTITSTLEFAFLGVPQKPMRKHLRKIATDMLVERVRNWKRSLILTEKKLNQKIELKGETPNLSQELQNTKESRMRLDTFLLAQ